MHVSVRLSLLAIRTNPGKNLRHAQFSMEGNTS
jgi:hypothetical protein